ncbi:MAG: riboflavin synthase [Candidatus Omnitrophota bacterium]
MFSGIIEELGVVHKISKTTDIFKLKVKAEKVITDLNVGDSIAVNGVCLTVVKFDAQNISFDVMAETIKKTNFKQLNIGDAVNLERALKFSQRVGGHFITGHIDTTGRVIKKARQGAIFYLRIAIERDISGYLVDRGAIAVEGVSLTVAESKEKYFSVYLIPHTISSTNLKYKRVGDILNLEADILGKYAAKAVEKQTGAMNVEKLKRWGYA